MNDLIKKAQGSFVGLAVGDALGQPTEGKTMEEIKANWGRITGFLDDDPVGSDDTEYAIFNSELIFKYGYGLSTENIMNAWKKDIISQKRSFKGAGFSEMAAIDNLRKGLKPPLSGKHIHSWSDGLAMRATPFGIIAAGDPDLAADLTRRDGYVTHSGEGILSGEATAVAISVAMEGASNNEIFQEVLNYIPSDSWTFRAISRGIDVGQRYDNVWPALKPLYDEIAVDYYYWPDLGPEALGLAFGLLAIDQNFRETVLAGVNIGRDTDTVAGIIGAIIGARIGIDNIPKEWSKEINEVKGICIDTVKGINIKEVAKKLGEMMIAKKGGDR